MSDSELEPIVKAIIAISRARAELTGAAAEALFSSYTPGLEEFPPAVTKLVEAIRESGRTLDEALALLDPIAGFEEVGLQR